MDKINLQGVFILGYGFNPKAIWTTSELTRDEKTMWQYLASYTGTGQDCFPSTPTISSHLSMKRNTVVSVLRSLEKKHYLKIVHSPGYVNHYTLQLDKIPKMDSKDTCIPKGGTPSRDTGVVSPEIQVPVSAGIHEQEQVTITDNKNSETRRFKKPSLDDVRAYMISQGLPPSEAKVFIDYFNSVGWIVGRTQKPMKCWKGAVTTWKRNWEKDREHGREKKNILPFRNRNVAVEQMGEMIDAGLIDNYFEEVEYDTQSIHDQTGDVLPGEPVRRRLIGEKVPEPEARGT